MTIPDTQNGYQVMFYHLSITSRGVIFISCSSSTTSAAGSGGLLLENLPRHPRTELRTLPKAEAILGENRFLMLLVDLEMGEKMGKVWKGTQSWGSKMISLVVQWDQDFVRSFLSQSQKWNGWNKQTQHNKQLITAQIGPLFQGSLNTRLFPNCSRGGKNWTPKAFWFLPSPVTFNSKRPKHQTLFLYIKVALALSHWSSTHGSHGSRAPPGQFAAGRGCALGAKTANGGRWNCWDAPMGELWLWWLWRKPKAKESQMAPILSGHVRTWLPHNFFGPALQPDSERFQQGSRTVPVFRGVHFSVTSPRPQRLKPNRFAVGNKMENGYLMRGIGLGSFQYIWKNESKPLALPLCRKGLRIVILHFLRTRHLASSFSKKRHIRTGFPGVSSWNPEGVEP